MSIQRRGDKFRVFIYDPTSKKSTPIGTFDSMPDAREAEENAKGAVNTAEFVAPSKQTVAEFIEKSWLPAVALRRTSGYGECEYHARHIIRHLGPLPIQKLSATRITKFFGDLMVEKLSQTYVQKVAKSLTNALALALKYKQVSRNEATFAERPKGKTWNRTPENIKIWSPQELVRLFDYCEEWIAMNSKPGHIQISREERQAQVHAWLVQATTGLRRSEVLALHWEDIDFDKAELTVRYSLPPMKGGMENVHLRQPKSKCSYRTIALFPETVAALRAHKLAWQRYSATEGEWADMAFCTQEGGPVPLSTYARRLGVVCKEAGITVLNTHSFRHTHATILLRDLGWDIARVKDRLGHSSVTITEVYLHFCTADQHDAIRKSGPFLGLAGETRD